MTRVSLPVCLAEPLNALQRSAELLKNDMLIDMMANVSNNKKDLENNNDTP